MSYLLTEILHTDDYHSPGGVMDQRSIEHETALEGTRLLMMHARYGEDISVHVHDGMVVWPANDDGLLLDDYGHGDGQALRQALIFAGVASAWEGSPRCYRLNCDIASAEEFLQDRRFSYNDMIRLIGAMTFRADLPSTRRPFPVPPGYKTLCALLSEQGLMTMNEGAVCWMNKARPLFPDAWNEQGESLNDLIAQSFQDEIDVMWRTMPEPLRRELFPNPNGGKMPDRLAIAALIGELWTGEEWKTFQSSESNEVSLAWSRVQALIDRSSEDYS